MAKKGLGLKEPQKDLKTRKLEKNWKKRKAQLKNEKKCDKMVITDCDSEKLFNLIEVIKTRTENLPETLSFLSKRLKFATKVSPKNIPDEVVTMN